MVTTTPSSSSSIIIISSISIISIIIIISSSSSCCCCCCCSRCCCCWCCCYCYFGCCCCWQKTPGEHLGPWGPKNVCFAESSLSGSHWCNSTDSVWFWLIDRWPPFPYMCDMLCLRDGGLSKSDDIQEKKPFLALSGSPRCSLALWKRPKKAKTGRSEKSRKAPLPARPDTSMVGPKWVFGSPWSVESR